MSIQVQTDWRSPHQVFYHTVHGLDMSGVPQHQVDELIVYYDAISSNIQQRNINFNKDYPSAVCGQRGHSFDECSFIAKHELVQEAYLQTCVAPN